jgi:hypothetical protein
LSWVKRNLRALAPAFVVLAGSLAGAQGAQSAKISAAYTTKNAWSFVSAPSLHPPKLRALKSVANRRLARGYFMLVNNKDLALSRPMAGQGGPMIVDSHLQPVWFNPVCVRRCGSQDLFAFNLIEQTYLGKPVLSWWQGALNAVGDPSTGQDVFVDQHYRTVAKLTASGGWVLSEHEFLIDGPNVWVTVYKPLTMDLRPYGGAQKGQLLDSGVQEYNLKTGQLLYTWDALAHVPLSDSYQKPSATGSPAWDAYHVNSIGLPDSKTFLVSMRNTWAAYLVNRSTGVAQWNLGGKRSTFKFGRKAAFQWQHDVQLLRGNKVSLFDDHCCLFKGKKPVLSGPARGLVLRLDTIHHTATFVAQYLRGRRFDVAFLGGTQLLPGGNVAVGWGSQPFFSEFSRSGKLLLDAIFPPPDLTGWAWVQRWVGTPFFPPSGAVRSSRGKTTVYASWNGATQVAAWRVLGGPNAKHLHAVARQRKTGFETAIPLSKSFGVYEAQALNGAGKVIGTSKSFSVSRRSAPPSSPGFY